MHVIFVAPRQDHKYLKAIKRTGAAITGIGMEPTSMLPTDVKACLDDYLQVASLYDENTLAQAALRICKQRKTHRLIATSELHVLGAAKAREICGLPGVNYTQTHICRDKPAMKAFMGRNQIPCAAFIKATRVDEIVAFAKTYGFPIIVKPVAGVASQNTWRINNIDELMQVAKHSDLKREPSVAVEEFIDGVEGTYDTITINGQVVLEFATHYYPNVLTSTKDRSITPFAITTNRLDSEPTYNTLKIMGRKVIQALGLGTTATHMEWLSGSKGLMFSEIGARPPAADFWDLYSAANDIDLYQEWANAMIFGKVSSSSRPLSRRYAAALISFRPTADGTVQAYHGLEQVQRKFGDHIFQARILPVGSRTDAMKLGFTGNSWLKLRHPNYDTLHAMLEEIASTVKMVASP